MKKILITLAAVDFLSVKENVNPERLGIIGICGWGGMAINAAALDPRIKSTVTSTMYDMSRVARGGYFGSTDKAGVIPYNKMEAFFKDNLK